MSQPVFVLTCKDCVLREEKAANINSIVLGLTRKHTKQHNTLLGDSSEKKFAISRPIPVLER